MDEKEALLRKVAQQMLDDQASWRLPLEPCRETTATTLKWEQSDRETLELLADGWDIIESSGSIGEMTIQAPPHWNEPGPREIVFTFSSPLPAAQEPDEKSGPPREPTQTMMDALLYHSSADTTYGDAYTMWTAAHDTWFRDGPDRTGPDWSTTTETAAP